MRWHSVLGAIVSKAKANHSNGNRRKSMARTLLAQLSSTMDKSAFHIHIDAALLPSELESVAKEKFGFDDDDFDHSLSVGGRTYPARHLTRKIDRRSDKELVRQICQSLSKEADAAGFKGLIQAEFIMARQAWTEPSPTGLRVDSGQLPSPPFRVHTRRLDSSRGEFFKKHELHLDLDPAGTSPEIIDALSGIGLLSSRGDWGVTFTASGNPNEIRAVRKCLERFLAPRARFVRGTLVTEATAYFSLHGLSQSDLPEVVDRVEILEKRSAELLKSAER
jgi:hypothetical protein